MPVMPGYEYADKPHDKTVIDLSYRYGCHNTIRNFNSEPIVQDGWNQDGTRRTVQIVSKWLPAVACGHLTRDTDLYCKECFNL